MKIFLSAWRTKAEHTCFTYRLDRTIGQFRKD